MARELNDDYGLQKLMLINSANYDFAEIPLDASVSLIGGNNSGKTSVINALQFLFIRNFNQMEFGSYERNASKTFYFPSSCSYILLEVQLKKNLVVIGCVGKGVSHDYEYFSYAGSLKKEHFENDEGFIVEGSKLVQHLGEKGIDAFVYRRPSEFFDDLYGKSDFIKNRPDIRLFSAASNLSNAFQEVLVKTLNLKQLDAQDVKRFLLQITGSTYEREYDFNKVWRESFRTVENDKAQFQACQRLKKRIETLENTSNEVRGLRGKIGTMKPLIDTALDEWNSYRINKHNEYVSVKQSYSNQIESLQNDYDRLNRENWDINSKINSLKNDDEEMSRLDIQFAHIVDRAVLQDVYDQKDIIVSQKKAVLQNAKRGDLDAITRKIEKAENDIKQLKNELHAGDKLFRKQIKQFLSIEELEILYGLLSYKILTLDAEKIGDIEAFAVEFSRYLSQQGEILTINGLTIERAAIRQKIAERDPKDIEKDIQSLKNDIEIFKQEQSALQDREKCLEELKKLVNELAAAKSNLDQFDRLQDLRKNEAERKREKEELQEQFNANKNKTGEIKNTQQRLRDESSSVDNELKKLDADAKEIEKNKEQRIDDEPFFTNILDMSHDPYYFEGDVLKDLNQVLQAQKNDCIKLKDKESSISAIMQELNAGGFNKFHGQNSQDEQIEAIVNFAKNLADEERQIQDEMRAAIASVANGLKRLEHQYNDFCRELISFNSIVQKRKVSDLEKMAIESKELPALDAIRIFSKYSTDNEESFDLFSLEIKNNSAGNAELDKAKDILLKVCSEKGCLKLENLFELSFIVCKKGGSPQEFKNLENMASNGTTLMAKLLYGLALLYRMSDKSERVMSVCYLDEAANLDAENQRNLILSAKEFGFNLLFASPEPQTTARYCIAVGHIGNRNIITEKQIQILEKNTDA